jgi:membrane-bound lytic murein transglycosylase D
MKATLLLFAALSVVACATASPTPSITPAPPPAARDVLADLDHERVDHWVAEFTRGAKQAEFASYMQRMPQYEEMIRAKLRRRGMPEDLVYLAMIESGFNPEAHSAAAARGIWQLVPDTARRYGLRVDDTLDERIDAEKATDAALSYLSYLFNRFGSWYLAAAAYNTGENRVAAIMTEAFGRERGSDAEYYEIWDRFPGETRDFVPVMVAARRVVNASRG